MQWLLKIIFPECILGKGRDPDLTPKTDNTVYKVLTPKISRMTLKKIMFKINSIFLLKKFMNIYL